jgi:hypothetical protein
LLNYFICDSKLYLQNEGLAMGLPSSAFFSEIYLKHHENKVIHILNKHQVLVYLLFYLDDVFGNYDKKISDINNILQDLNISQTLLFSLEHEQNNNINFLDITIIRNIDSLQFLPSILHIFCFT